MRTGLKTGASNIKTSNNLTNEASHRGTNKIKEKGPFANDNSTGYHQVPAPAEPPKARIHSFILELTLTPLMV